MLTPEEFAILSAPVPQEEVKSYEGKGGKIMRYTSVEFVQDRIAQVDPNYDRIVEQGPRGITVHYVINGVKRGDAFDYEEGAKYGTPVTNGLARACRRAGKQFHIAEELWQDDREDSATEEAPRQPARSSYSASSKPSNGRYSNGKTTGIREPGAGHSTGGSSGTALATDGQVAWLTKSVDEGGFDVPKALAVKLPKVAASKLIDLLKEAREQDGYEEDPNPFIAGALEDLGQKALLKFLEA